MRSCSLHLIIVRSYPFCSTASSGRYDNIGLIVYDTNARVVYFSYEGRTGTRDAALRPSFCIKSNKKKRKRHRKGRGSSNGRRDGERFLLQRYLDWITREGGGEREGDLSCLLDFQ